MKPLEVESLTKKFIPSNYFGFKQKTKTFTAVNNISFCLNPGEFLGFLGPNGAGKTTTIQMLISVMRPTSGIIKYFDLNLFKNRHVLKKISYASGYMKLPSSLTVKQCLQMQGMLYDMKSTILKEKIDFFLKTFHIKHLEDRPASYLSAGQTTSVLLARAFLTNPEIVLLDEPTAALDPESAKRVRSFIYKQNKKYGTSILFTSHNMPEVAELCSRIIVLKTGKIIADNSPEKLASSVSTAKIQLIIGDGMKRTINYARENNLRFKLEDRHIEIAIDERKISEFLSTLAQLEITYSQISIEKPNLEDYFLSLTKKQEPEIINQL